MKVWVTKYALTDGIKEVEGEEKLIGDTIYFKAIGTIFPKGTYHINYDFAKAKAVEMRHAKIASLQKQIAKLEKLEF